MAGEKMRILVITGTRTDERRGEVTALLARLQPDIDLVIVGCCPTGVDAEARNTCQVRGIDHLVAPALWMAHGRKAGPRRNALMAKVAAMLRSATVDKVTYAAFPAAVSPGTYGAAELLKRAGIEREP